MKPYTIVGIYLDDHSAIIEHVFADAPSYAHPVKSDPDDTRAYIILAVFDGHITTADNER